MSNVVELFKQLKDEAEQRAFIDKQHSTITTLISKNKALEEEITHLKTLLVGLVEHTPVVERIIVTPEEALIDAQLNILQQRSIGIEISLEDAKKLDLLLKNKKIIKEEHKTLKGESKTLEKSSLSRETLISIAAMGKLNESS